MPQIYKKIPKDASNCQKINIFVGKNNQYGK